MEPVVLAGVIGFPETLIRITVDVVQTVREPCDVQMEDDPEESSEEHCSSPREIIRENKTGKHCNRIDPSVPFVETRISVREHRIEIRRRRSDDFETQPSDVGPPEPLPARVLARTVRIPRTFGVRMVLPVVSAPLGNETLSSQTRTERQHHLRREVALEGAVRKHAVVPERNPYLPQGVEQEKPAPRPETKATVVNAAPNELVVMEAVPHGIGCHHM